MCFESLCIVVKSVGSNFHHTMCLTKLNIIKWKTAKHYNSTILYNQIKQTIQKIISLQRPQGFMNKRCCKNTMSTEILHLS